MAMGKVKITDVACICGSLHISTGQCYSGWKMAIGRKCPLVLHKHLRCPSTGGIWEERILRIRLQQGKSEVNFTGSEDNGVDSRHCLYLARWPQHSSSHRPWQLPVENLTHSPWSCLIAEARRVEGLGHYSHWEYPQPRWMEINGHVSPFLCPSGGGFLHWSGFCTFFQRWPTHRVPAASLTHLPQPFFSPTPLLVIPGIISQTNVS